VAGNRQIKEALCSRQVTVFAEEEFNHVANTVDGTVEINPLIGHLDVGFIKVPLANDGTLALAETRQQPGRELNAPAVYGRLTDAQLRSAIIPSRSRRLRL